jgi:hypothetical protein
MHDSWHMAVPIILKSISYSSHKHVIRVRVTCAIRTGEISSHLSTRHNVVWSSQVVSMRRWTRATVCGVAWRIDECAGMRQRTSYSDCVCSNLLNACSSSFQHFAACSLGSDRMRVAGPMSAGTLALVADDWILRRWRISKIAHYAGMYRNKRELLCNS